jgi:hypothetical protein
MDKSHLRIPKHQVPVTLWVHPEGRVLGAIFVHPPGPDSARGEEPADVLNQPESFVVVKRDNPDETRFYNKSAVVRLEYWESGDSAFAGTPLPCRVTLMDGSLIDGEICKALPPERSRLYDYMNEVAERFLKLHLGKGEQMLINKSYIVSIGTLEAQAADAEAPDDPEGGPGPIEGPLELAA